MQDTDIQYRNDNIQNVDYLCQNCGKNCDSNSSAVQCDACDIWVHYKCERLDIKSIEEIENNFNTIYWLHLFWALCIHQCIIVLCSVSTLAYS
jgi:DNA-directed RNA polymerase subunit RPC12/RpoP